MKIATTNRTINELYCSVCSVYCFIVLFVILYLPKEENINNTFYLDSQKKLDVDYILRFSCYKQNSIGKTKTFREL